MITGRAVPQQGKCINAAPGNATARPPLPRLNGTSPRSRHGALRDRSCLAPAGLSALHIAPAPHNLDTTISNSSRLRSVIARAVEAPPAPTSTAPEELSRHSYDAGGVTVVGSKDGSGYSVYVEAAEPRAMVLHWAVDDWIAPPNDVLPDGTHRVDEKAVQTPFRDGRSVHLHFPTGLAPERVVFVLKELQPENWINNGSCFSVQLKPPGLGKLTERVLECEGNAEHWSLKDRLVLANDVLDGCAAAGAEGMAFMFTWLRLSSAKLLSWARRSNYQSKDIVWMQKVTSERMTDKARSSPDPWVRLYARLTMAGLPRGGGNGDDIRMGILHIMRDHGIKEGHRPGLDEPFLEQWHQKLHQNTTPEDVTICEAWC